MLALQDQWGTDTNVLLYCCWLAGAGRALDKRQLRRAMAAMASWQAEVIQPVRRVRRAVKAAAAALPPEWGADLRRRIGRLELDLEYLEQRSLYDLAQQLPPARALPPRAAAQASIARYLALLALPAEVATSAPVGTLLDACWPPPR